MQSQQKWEIRAYIKEQKKRMSAEDITGRSLIIEKALFAQKEYQETENILIYVSYNQEVMTRGIIQHSLQIGKNIFVPRVSHDRIEFHQIYSFERDLQPGAYGILEPVTMRRQDIPAGLLIMPGLAFDRNFHRIGYGGGYYDKYIALHDVHKKIALAYEFQLLASLETETYDRTVDMIITEEQILKRI